MQITEELIDAAVGQCSVAMELILEFYDEYLTSLAYVDYCDKDGRRIHYYDPEVKNRMQQRLREAIPDFLYKPIKNGHI